MSPKKSKRKIKSSTKEDIVQIIDNLSLVTGRKKMPTDDAKGAITSSFQVTDAKIAAVSLHIPKIDTKWETLGAKESFFKIRKNRQWLLRSLYGLGIFVLLITIAGVIFGILYIDTWVKWLVVGIGAILIVIGSLGATSLIINPYITNYDNKIPNKFENECNNINKFIQELLKIIKK